MAGSMDKTSALLERTPQARDEAVLVHTYGLTKSFGTRLAVNQVDLEVRRGDVFGLLGPNGSGKTTTLRMMLGLIFPSSGRIALFGRDVSNASEHQAALKRVGAIAEQPAFYPYLSGRENLLGAATFSAWPDSAATRARVEAVVQQGGLGPRARDAYKKYSLGMKQRLGIAAAFVRRP